jgi:hypothetical protein
MLTTRPPLTTPRRLAALVAAGLALAAALAVPAPARAGALERELLNQAPDILNYLRTKGYEKVGVLKFRVGKDGQVTDNAGPLNLNFASRLETALLLKYDMKEDSRLTLIHDASATAAKLKGANHLTTEGRQRLLAGKYRALWGKQAEVSADAFLTGRIDFSEDLRTLTVAVCAFGRDCQVQKVVVFHAASGVNTLFEVGESFNLRSFLTKKGTFEEVQLDDAAAGEAKKEDKGKADQPPLDSKLVGLEIHYVDRATGNDLVVPPQGAPGQLLLAEPTEGQDVYFVLKRNDPDPKARYGVVLMVNGVNTLFEERLPPQLCTKWILEPGSPPITVRGFQTSNNKASPFVIRSPAESKANEVRYGADVGTLSYSIFREQPAAPKKESLDDDPKTQEAAVVNPPAPPADLPKDGGPAKLPDSAAPLKSQATNADKLLGLIERSGFEVESGVEHVSFTNPVLVSTATIRYYKPQR